MTAVVELSLSKRDEKPLTPQNVRMDLICTAVAPGMFGSRTPLKIKILCSEEEHSHRPQDKEPSSIWRSPCPHLSQGRFSGKKEKTLSLLGTQRKLPATYRLSPCHLYHLYPQSHGLFPSSSSAAVIGLACFNLFPETA